jgi:hypothetical protein
MSATAEHVSSVHLSDPLPTGCSACMSAPTEGVRFVDFSAAFDGGAIVGPSGEAIRSLDELHLCEPCLRAAGEALAFKPELHARQLQEIRRLEVVAEHWEAAGGDAQGSPRRPAVRSQGQAMITEPED